MSLRWLLDTNVVSDHVSGISGVRARFDVTPVSTAAVSVITEHEIEYGLVLTPARARAVRPGIHAFLAKITVLPLTREDARAAAAIRAALHRSGTPVGPYDLLLAGTALARGLTLVTSNTREFTRVDGLLVETWR